MRVEVKTTDLDEYLRAGLEAPLPQPLWNDPVLMPDRGPTLALRALRGNRVVGFWLVPIEDRSGAALVACRPCRLFPYAAPWLADQENLRRREVVTALVSTLQKLVGTIDLPMAPGFKDANAAVAVGCFAEWRHTHVITRQQWMRRGESCFSAKKRGSARRAERSVRISIQDTSSQFRFDKAIHGDEQTVAARKALAFSLDKLGRAKTLVAECGETEVGGAFLAYDAETAYLYHTWFDRGALRGVPSLLVREALRWAFDLSKMERFDFEGSILATVDYFISGFGAEIEPYAHLFWSRTREGVVARILNSFDIEGRVAPGAN